MRMCGGLTLSKLVPEIPAEHRERPLGCFCQITQGVIIAVSFGCNFTVFTGAYSEYNLVWQNERLYRTYGNLRVVGV